MITYQKVTDSGKIGLICTGHANYAPKGFDIVCASVSAIVQTAALGVQKYDPQALVNVGDGSFAIACYDKSKTRALIDTAIMGLDAVREQHPESFG